jgi:exosortase/archaeosortase family protein
MGDAYKKVVNFGIRYLILILVAFPGLILFYKIFSPLTIYPSYWLLGLFFDTSIYSNIILLDNSFVVEIIPACVMGSAYYLLLVLNLSVPNIKLKKRIIMLLTAFTSLLIVNILRIVLLGSLYNLGSIWGDPLHTFFWYFLSIAFVIGIWFAQVKIFKVKDIPFYTDLKFLFRNSLINKKRSKKKKSVKKKPKKKLVKRKLSQ